MAKRLFEQCQVTLNGVDVSADVNAARVVTGRRAPVDVTGLSDSFDSFLVPNLRNWGISLDFFNNFAGTSESPTGISTVLQQVFMSTGTSGVTLTLRSTTNLRTVNNPEWTGQVQIDGDFQQTGGGVAEADRGSVNFKGLGIMSRYTSST